ncbi:class I SAM-dependent DNA methyltransferase [Metabacillus sp. Hm71]|uniref:class I SAM-dependent DNA methyltransferase n=1 Tax=Metabacillus sp. Hm71 TaxID=3450743 RepID=UPI003F425332
MEYRGPSAYNDDQFFENYITRRNREVSPNNIIEKPILLEMIGDVKRKKVLDLGCGDAKFGVELLKKGCISYDGVEGSENMVKEAIKNLSGTVGNVQFSFIETWIFKEKQYDLVVSRLALHYLSDLNKVFQGVYNTLEDNGKFIFSVQHPVLLSSVKSASVSALKSNWIVDNYFKSGERVEPWINKKVVKYHRTIEEYFQLLKQAGFKIVDIKEGTPRIEQFKSESEYERRMRIPLFLMFSCEK